MTRGRLWAELPSPKVTAEAELSMRNKLAQGLFLLTCSLLPSFLLAGDVTVYTGIQNPGKLTVGNVLRETNLGAVVGARISAGRIIGFEQTFGYSPNFLESGNRSFNTQSNVVIGVPLVGFSPYGTVGVGLVTTWGRPPVDFHNIGTKFTVNYGGGIKMHNVLGPLGLRLDVRGYSVPRVFDQTLNFVEATIGIMFSW